MTVSIRRIGTVAMLGLLLIGCSATADSGDSGPGEPTSFPPARSASPVERPVDPSIQPVSKSKPSADAAAALKACGATASHPDRLAAIDGVGFVPHAIDVPNYTYLWGTEPEINTDHPAWVVQFKGKINLDAFWAIDPVCVSVDGRTHMFSPGPYGSGDQQENPPTPNMPK